jgi:hypothetical protein
LSSASGSQHHHHCQPPRFTKATTTNKADQFVASKGTSYIAHMPCGWSKDGLQTFNALAKEVHIDRKEHGEEFDKAFKKSIEQEMASTNNKTGKRKRNCIDTYNDLNEGELMTSKDEDNSDEEQEGKWVRENVFVV